MNRSNRSQIPGGGVGIFNGCTNEWGAPSAGWGAQYGGISDQSSCDSFPEALKAGCNWRYDWFMGADNPSVSFTQVACPAALTANTGCARADDAGAPAPAPASASPVASSSSSSSTPARTRCNYLFARRTSTVKHLGISSYYLGAFGLRRDLPAAANFEHHYSRHEQHHFRDPGGRNGDD